MNNKSIIEEIVNQFCKCCEEGPSRYRSWIWCYDIFKNCFIGIDKEKNKITEDTYDYLALNLAFYLASWGMYRGSSLILQFDYKIYIDLIKKLPANLSLDNIDDIGKAFSDILNYFKELKKPYSSEYNLPNPTATLATKILMGIYGITPAFDRFFIDGIKTQLTNEAFSEIKPNMFTSKKEDDFKAVITVLNNFIDNNEIKEQTRKPNKEKSNKMQDYQLPPMKIIDMYFWQLGYNAQIPNLKEKIREKNEELGKINEQLNSK